MSNFRYEIVKGQDIIEAYLTGPQTCMLSKRQTEEDPITAKAGIYLFVNNPQKVNLVKIFKNNKYIGRSLLWQTDQEIQILDRIYPSDGGNHIEYIRQVAIDSGWDYKNSNTWATSFYSGKTDYSVTLNYDGSFPLPYMDTFRLTNGEDKEIITLFADISNPETERKDLSVYRSEKWLLNDSNGILSERKQCVISGYYGHIKRFIRFRFTDGIIGEVHKSYVSENERISNYLGDLFAFRKDLISDLYTREHIHIADCVTCYNGIQISKQSSVKLSDGTIASRHDRNLYILFDGDSYSHVISEFENSSDYIKIDNSRFLINKKSLDNSIDLLIEYLLNEFLSKICKSFPDKKLLFNPSDLSDELLISNFLFVPKYFSENTSLESDKKYTTTLVCYNTLFKIQAYEIKFKNIVEFNEFKTYYNNLMTVLEKEMREFCNKQRFNDLNGTDYINFMYSAKYLEIMKIFQQNYESVFNQILKVMAKSFISFVKMQGVNINSTFFYKDNEFFTKIQLLAIRKDKEIKE